MPQHKSAKKRVRSNEKKRLRNKSYKTRIRSAVKELRETSDKTKAETMYKEVSSILDRYATKGVIHTNTAANKKSKLSKHVKKLG